jgi:hypothetical protein
MSAPYRIKRSDVGVKAVVPTTPKDDFNSYLDRLMKMIPAEVIALYLVGSSLIPKEQSIGLVVWSVVCLIGVILLRAYGTADSTENKPTDWTHTIISAVAFVIWIYSLGGPFEAYKLQIPWIGSLAILAYTFFVPIFYKGPKE